MNAQEAETCQRGWRGAGCSCCSHGLGWGLSPAGDLALGLAPGAWDQQRWGEAGCGLSAKGRHERPL